MKNSLFYLTGIIAFAIASFVIAQTVNNSLQINVSVVVPPNSPTSTTAVAVSSSQINITWRDASNNESGFYIEESVGNNSFFTQIDSVGPNVTSYSRTGLLSDTAYFYRVRAFNVAGTSAYSNESNAVTLSAPVVTPPPVIGNSGGGGVSGSVLPAAPVELPSKEKAQALSAIDFNGDGRIGIVDLSIILYYFGQKVDSNSARYDLNHDGKIDIIDVSILLYYWTS